MLLCCTCKVRNDVVPADNDEYEEITLSYGCAYGDAHEEQVAEQVFAFAIGDVQIDDKGEVTDNSNGYCLRLVLFADELSHDQLIKAGSYPVSVKVKPWSTLQGDDVDPDHPGYAYRGSVLYKVEDGFRTEAVKIKSGSVSVEGNADNVRFTIDVAGFDGKDYKYKSSGAIKMLDSLPAPDAFYKGYEWDTVQQVTINADYAELKTNDNHNMFSLWLSNSKGGYSAYIVAYYQNTGNKMVGTFPVGTDPYDETPGTVMFSRGCRNGSLYATYAGVTEDRVVYDCNYHSIFFVTGGSMTIDENDNVNATFTTFYGSTVNVSFSGKFTRK